MQDGLRIYSFAFGNRPAMAYEASEEEAYEAATRHRAAILTDRADSRPTRTLIYRIILRPVSAETIAALMNGDLGVLPALIETMEPIGHVE
jgi:hypothetical protein